ncbi:MAG: PEP-CTERM system histidine kinase PrsK [Desulfuromonadaceae bacterium]|nr:PEP-CTERM system histidine kinase PrsK [Desulfuromonadaceae bacterium]
MIHIGNVTITIAAVAALLAVGGYTYFKERSRSSLLLFAALICTVLLESFDLLALAMPQSAFFWKKCALTAEALLPSLWLVCSLTFARQAGPWKVGLPLKAVIFSTFLLSLFPRIMPLNDFFYAPDFPGERILFLGDTGFYFYFTIMTCLVVALVNFEVTFTNASPDALTKIKFELIGLATIVVVQVFYFSQALLYRSLNMSYLSLRSFIYLVAAGLMGYSFASRRGKVRIQVSRQVAFKSFVLFAVGIYLVVLGLLGEGMKHLGAFFPRVVTISVAFLIGIGLLILILSERFRREVKVTLHKNFYQHKHDYRTQWLRFTEQLSSSRSGEELLQHILLAYNTIFGFSGSALFLLDESNSGYRLQAEHEMQLQDELIAQDNSLICFMAKREWVISIAEENSEYAEADVQLFQNNAVLFIVPLFGRERLEGFIVLGKPLNRKEVYIYEDFDLMKTISRQASLAIMHQRLSEEISHAREIEAIGNVATFVAHDLKNLVSNLSLIVENAARYIHNPDFQEDMIMSLRNTVDKMLKLIGRLKNLGETNYISKKPVNLLELAQRTAQLVAGSTVNVSGTAEIVHLDENEIQKVILNLILNAIEASGPHDPVEIEVGSASMSYIRVTDHGCGISNQFLRSELFKPFKTTKKQGLGVGLYQCRQIVEAHAGKIEATSVEGSGSVFTVWFADCAEPEGVASGKTIDN